MAEIGKRIVLRAWRVELPEWERFAFAGESFKFVDCRLRMKLLEVKEL